MVQWSDSERKTIASVWSKINVDEIGPQTLARVLVVYPWTQRYFGAFGDLSCASAIMGNPKVSEHGKTVLKALEKAVKNVDDIKTTYAQLSQLHCEKLNVDPDNFKLLADCLSIVIATNFGPAFNPAVQSTWQKLLSVVVAALTSRYF
nr:Zgc:92880 [Danio rerio]AAI64891.1 Zgc:92880 protein [Danio rerio]